MGILSQGISSGQRGQAVREVGRSDGGGGKKDRLQNRFGRPPKAPKLGWDQLPIFGQGIECKVRPGITVNYYGIE